MSAITLSVTRARGKGPGALRVARGFRRVRVPPQAVVVQVAVLVHALRVLLRDAQPFRRAEQTCTSGCSTRDALYSTCTAKDAALSNTFTIGILQYLKYLHLKYTTL